MMTDAELILWEKIEAFKLDDEKALLKFSERLARENGWKPDYTQRVITEYKKFLLLCCISETGVTPSYPVDQAWHLHILYTKSYWVDFCKNTVGQEIHHHPTKGGEKERLNELSTYSRRLYIEVFGESPPADIWHNNVNLKKDNMRNYWLIKKPQLCWPTPIFQFNIFLGVVLLLAMSDDIKDLLLMCVIVALVVYLVYIYKGRNDGNGTNECSGNSNGDYGHHNSHHSGQDDYSHHAGHHSCDSGGHHSCRSSH